MNGDTNFEKQSDNVNNDLDEVVILSKTMAGSLQHTYNI